MKKLHKPILPTEQQMQIDDLKFELADERRRADSLMETLDASQRERDALREALQAILSTTMMDRQNPDIWEPRVAKARAALEAKP